MAARAHRASSPALHSCPIDQLTLDPRSRYGAAWVAQDAARIAALFTADASYVSSRWVYSFGSMLVTINGAVHVGRATVRRGWDVLRSRSDPRVLDEAGGCAPDEHSVPAT